METMAGKENEKHKKDTQQREDNKTKRQRGKKDERKKIMKET